MALDLTALTGMSPEQLRRYARAVQELEKGKTMYPDKENTPSPAVWPAEVLAQWAREYVDLYKRITTLQEELGRNGAKLTEQVQLRGQDRLLVIDQTTKTVYRLTRDGRPGGAARVAHDVEVIS